MDLNDFAAAVGSQDAVTIVGQGTRGGGVPDVRSVRAPSGIEWVQADEMTACCGAGTPVVDLDAALREVGQCVALPQGGTIGGAFAVGLSDVRRLGYGPVRDVLLQARYVSAAGEVVKAGGPTVKNVSGFDLCRLLVGSRGTLGFLGEVIVRTRPLPQCSQWYTTTAAEPFTVFAALYRPVAVLWDGERVWALLEGHRADVAAQAATAHLDVADEPPVLPVGGRTSVAPATIEHLTGGFVAEVGVGVVHWRSAQPTTRSSRDPSLTALEERIKLQFDPVRRLNPGVRLGTERWHGAGR